MPLLVISPWARPNYVDYTLTNQASILRFIQDNWHLGHIDGSADVGSGALANMFDFSTPAGTTPVLLLNPATGQPQARTTVRYHRDCEARTVPGPVGPGTVRIGPDRISPFMQAEPTVLETTHPNRLTSGGASDSISPHVSGMLRGVSG